jgi:hypothetical protein
MFCTVMSPFRSPSMKLVLLLALILPLQNFASAWSCGARGTAAAAAHHDCANERGSPQTAAEQHHHCGSCCVAAIAPLPYCWTAPRSVNPQDSLPRHGRPPQVALDRLDRPPRLDPS